MMLCRCANTVCGDRDERVGKCFETVCKCLLKTLILILELRESVAAELSASVDAVENGDSTRDLEDVARLGWAGLEDAFPPP